MNLNMDAMDIIDYIDKSTYVILLRVYTESDTIQIPEQIDGKPVRELADHAFADEPSVLYAESEKRRAVRSGDCWTFQSAGAGASAAPTHFSGERTERPDASVNAAVPNSEGCDPSGCPCRDRQLCLLWLRQSEDRLLPGIDQADRVRAVQFVPCPLGAGLPTSRFSRSLCSTCYTCSAAGGAADGEP